MISTPSPETSAKTNSRLSVCAQDNFYSSPWSSKVLLKMALWEFAWLFFCRWTPKPMRPWRNIVLRTFGAQIAEPNFVASSANIKMPWNLKMEPRSCIGSKAQIYNLALVTIRERATIAQEAYLCCGTHKFDHPALPLVVGPIDVGADAFIGARAFVQPGIVIGAGAIIGACSVVTKDVEPWTISAGNPSKWLKNREHTEIG